MDATTVIEKLAQHYGATPEEMLEALAAKADAEPVGRKPSPQVQAGGGGPRSEPIPDATDEATNPQPRENPDEALLADPSATASAMAARDERMRLLPEYQKSFFLEDLPPINPEDPWNQGIYMRFRINQLRYVQGKPPVDFDDGKTNLGTSDGSKDAAPPETSAAGTPAPPPPAPPSDQGEPPVAPDGASGAPAPTDQAAPPA